MGAAQGSIDDWGRPIVRVTLASGEEILALLDTGFNGALLCNSTVATAVGVEPAGTREKVRLAGGLEQEVDRGWLKIIWLGRSIRVRVLVTPAEFSRGATMDGEPVALLGSALLAPHLVLLDYGASTVEIEEQ